MKIMMVAGCEVTLRFHRQSDTAWLVEGTVTSGKMDQRRTTEFRTHAATKEESERKALDKAGELIGNHAGAVNPEPDPP